MELGFIASQMHRKLIRTITSGVGLQPFSPQIFTRSFHSTLLQATASNVEIPGLDHAASYRPPMKRQSSDGPFERKLGGLSPGWKDTFANRLAASKVASRSRRVRSGYRCNNLFAGADECS